MKLLLSLSSLIPLTCFFTCGTAPPEPAAVEPTPKNDWRLYTPPDKSFSVELPCQPTQTNVSELSTPIYEYSCVREEASGLSFFIVSVMKLSDSEREKIRDEAAFETSVRDSFSPNKRLIKLVPFMIEGGMGREVIVTNTRDEMDNLRGRVIVYGSQRYEVSFVATDMKALESAAAERFFATFKPPG